MGEMALTRDPMEAVAFEQQVLPSWSELRRRLAEPRDLARPLTIHAIRHGETETNARGLVTGAQDVLLTERGRQQARDVGRALAPSYGAAFCSALSRSRETLELALRSGGTDVSEIFWDTRLNERSLGDLELKPSKPLPAYADGNLAFAPNGGDSYFEVARRMLSFLLDLADWSEAENASRVLLSGHMGPMRMPVAIVEEERSPVRALARSFANAQLLQLSLQRVVLPGYLLGAL